MLNERSRRCIEVGHESETRARERSEPWAAANAAVSREGTSSVTWSNAANNVPMAVDTTYLGRYSPALPDTDRRQS